MTRVVLILLLLCLPALAADPGKAPPKSSGVQLTDQDGKLRIEINGQLVTEYHYKGAPHLFFFPVMGPGQVEMTRHYPMDVREGEEHDHPHQRSLWFSHGAVNGHDFWAETPKSGRIVHRKFNEIQSGRDAGWFQASNEWVSQDGTVICTDETTVKFYQAGPGRTFDFEIRLKAPQGELRFGDTKEGSMGIRVAESMKVKGHAGENGIVTSEGLRDDAAWGTRAKWCDYHGLVDGKKVGVAIFDHPSNPRHPTWWHVRDYGLFAANPFGQHDFEKKPPGTGDFTVPAGQTVTFRYRIYLHEGDEKEAAVEDRYRDYAAGKVTSTGTGRRPTNPVKK